MNAATSLPPADWLDHARTETRRAFLRSSGVGLGGIALSSLLGQSLGAAAATVRAPHFAPRAKRVIYLHMVGAPSQLDLFDPKPALARYD